MFYNNRYVLRVSTACAVQGRRKLDFTTLTIDFLKQLSNIFGSYGLGIIALTVIIRLAMWPLNVSQQRSMKTMQKLQPKMKAIQDRYKNNPQMMQQKMMEFYKEHKFNPMAGCLPLLIQMPIFILLYSSLMSPQFISMAGQSNFLFINRLDATLKGNAGVSNDGKFSVGSRDTFSLNKNIKVYIGDKELEGAKLSNPRNALKVQGEITPGEPVDLKISLDDFDLKFSQLAKITKAEATVTDNNTREIEKVTFTRQGEVLAASVPTLAAKASFNYDVLILVVIFGASMFLTQKIMMATNKMASADPAQEAMQKSLGTMMPVMLTATFLFIPIPAGVLLYLISSNIIQVFQTMIINKQLDMETEQQKLAKGTVSDETPLNTKKVKAKEIKNIEKEDDK